MEVRFLRYSKVLQYISKVSFRGYLFGFMHLNSSPIANEQHINVNTKN